MADNDNLDADAGPIYYLYYNVYASDGVNPDAVEQVDTKAISIAKQNINYF